jgi:hypothetical protein
MWIPEIARAMRSRWISKVPSESERAGTRTLTEGVLAPVAREVNLVSEQMNEVGARQAVRPKSASNDGP